MNIYICNAFSLSMLPPEALQLGFKIHGVQDAGGECSKAWLKDRADLPHLYNIVSAVGHVDTAALYSSILGFQVEVNRTSIQLTEQDVLVVGQYNGPRLPEGATTLPEGATITWLLLALELEPDTRGVDVEDCVD